MYITRQDTRLHSYDSRNRPPSPPSSTCAPAARVGNIPMPSRYEPCLVSPPGLVHPSASPSGRAACITLPLPRAPSRLYYQHRAIVFCTSASTGVSSYITRSSRFPLRAPHTQQPQETPSLSHLSLVSSRLASSPLSALIYYLPFISLVAAAAVPTTICTAYSPSHMYSVPVLCTPPLPLPPFLGRVICRYSILSALFV